MYLLLLIRSTQTYLSSVSTAGFQLVSTTVLVRCTTSTWVFSTTRFLRIVRKFLSTRLKGRPSPLHTPLERVLVCVCACVGGVVVGSTSSSSRDAHKDPLPPPPFTRATLAPPIYAKGRQAQLFLLLEEEKSGFSFHHGNILPTLTGDPPPFSLAA